MHVKRIASCDRVAQRHVVEKTHRAEPCRRERPHWCRGRPRSIGRSVSASTSARSSGVKPERRSQAYSFASIARTSLPAPPSIGSAPIRAKCLI